MLIAVVELGWLLCSPCRLTFSYLCRFVHGAVADLWCCWFAYNGIGLRLAVMVDSRRDGSDGGLLLDELSRVSVNGAGGSAG